ncbi:SWPV2-ORF130 [Shearwaterpox virus]|uniref:SWPV2-ORF130 n=1 Tax=Shearwaterpox virus TaxID=1974596 RepID=A0A1V0QG90_CNPV|nr:SWPV2-ORF130 [Shearwaterpox virus]QRM15768.1 putative palmitylated eev envelope lipase [Penguinpox virus 2]QRM16100.1 putative palmitylated eev envelope lipase [Albatrosspox virus]
MGNSFKRLPKPDYQIVETIPQSLTAINTNNLSTYECFKKLIDIAKKEIYIVTFCCNLGSNPEGIDILNRLIDISAKIPVYILVDENSPHKDYERIKSSHIRYIKVDVGVLNNESVGSLLSNFWVVDRCHFYIGSASLMGNALTTIKNMGIYSENNSVAQDLYLRCVDYKIISKKKCLMLTRLATQYHLLKSHNGIFFSDSPERMIGRKRTYDLDCVIHYIDAAKSTIDLEIVSLLPTKRTKDAIVYWPIIKDALIRAVLERGVKLRILLGYWKKTDIISKASIKSLNELGVDSIDITTKVFIFPINSKVDDINNSKMMIVDNRYAHIMTANLDGSHFNHHAFISFNCIDQNLTKKIADVFERDWTSNYAKEITVINNT